MGLLSKNRQRTEKRKINVNGDNSGRNGKECGNRELTKVLIFPGGSEVGLEINKSLEKNKKISVIGCSSIIDHTQFAYENNMLIEETVQSSNFLRRIEDIVRDNKIDCVFPANDLVATKMADGNLPVIGSPKKTCALVNSKLELYQHFSSLLLVPEIYEKIKSYPVFIKPNCGSGAKNCHIIENKKELDFYLDEHLVMEYLPGEEYTIDCFTDWNGNLRYSGARTRTKTSCGLSTMTRTFKSDKLHEMAKKINSSLEFNGAWFFQVKKNTNHECVLIDLGCRIAGSSVASRIKGVNLSLLNILNFKKIDFEIEEKDGEVEISRSWDFKSKFHI